MRAPDRSARDLPSNFNNSPQYEKQGVFAALAFFLKFGTRVAIDKNH
jgi:hypothetical protein